MRFGADDFDEFFHQLNYNIMDVLLQFSNFNLANGSFHNILLCYKWFKDSSLPAGMQACPFAPYRSSLGLCN
jgi:hypothetical protein